MRCAGPSSSPAATAGANRSSSTTAPRLDSLGPLVDGILGHNRSIRSRYDDSVARVLAGRPAVIRRARGYAPAPLPLPVPVPEPVLAVGAQLKHTATLAVGGQAVVGPHTGDLADEASYEAFESTVDRLCRWQGVTPAVVAHDLHPEILRLMGRLKFRTSYGQNVLAHSAEVARLAGIMAREVGLDAHVAVRAAFVHDIGKAIDREMEGTHLQIGIDFLRKHGESEAVVMAMAAHHMDIDWPSLEAMIVQAADAISAARPGARRDILESYVKRLEKLEGIADSFKGVSKSFALQAGREIRIMVESEKISDEEAVWLSKDIARRIENELEYPGQIKVTVIRETRAVDYAK